MMACSQEEDILKNYKFLSSLGCGAFEEVILVQHLPTKTQVAIKVLNSEVAIHKSFHRRNIIQCFHSIITLRTTYLVMAYLEGKDLVMLINEAGCLTEKEARPIFNQLSSAVHFLHQRLITHRDIKLENILLRQGGKVKLCDFGLATQLIEGQMLKELWGTLPYLAPEIFAGTPYDALAGDMWSLEIVFYVLVTGHLPYVESTPEAMYHLITPSPCCIPYPYSRPCYLMLARLLTGYIWFRLTASRLVDCPWLGPIQEHLTPPAKEILPKVVETMCNIGYTHEQVVLSLKDPESNLTATINILKFKMSSGDSSLQHIIPAVATRVPATLKRSHSQAALLSRGKSTHTHLLHKHTCPEAVHSSDSTAPEEDALATETINPATGDTTVTMMSLDSLADEFSCPDPPLKGNCVGMVNMAFTEEKESREPEVPSDQPHLAPTASGTRTLRGWKLTKKRISSALRALCCCCLPTPPGQTEV